MSSPLIVEICMGSSCFARGNRQTLEVLESFLDSENLGDRVRLVGKLCMNECSQGPTLTVGGEIYRQVSPESAADLVRHALTLEEE